MLEVPPGEVVVVHELADFQHERPVWRLYMLADVLGGLYEALSWHNVFPARDAYEAFCRETAWGALYFATSPTGPVSAERTALRLRALLRFWEPLQSARYLFKSLEEVLTLEELMRASCDWAMEAWCPGEEGSVLVRLESAAKRMARATREDSLEAILRQMPQALSLAGDLKHRDVVADPAFQRERLTALDPVSFEHVSGACTADLLEKLYDWDRQLGHQ
ncbi:hypothetical protein BON30_11565 [Cystobacter ferrugineus]|uniref:Uncharacterized protein n=2 Tax=Cystobacter ferrugineus TaxID=83449 RepID=A0A1L9BGU9_9BACT|nr:hypothetical protein BON30_11565 [Cystobacter ferrugineus]